MTTPTEGGSGNDDAHIVDTFVPHLAQPCGGAGRQIHAFYINEGQRLLDTNAITDTAQRERLRIAILFCKLDSAFDTRASYDGIQEDMKEAEAIVAGNKIVDRVEAERCRMLLMLAKAIFKP